MTKRNHDPGEIQPFWPKQAIHHAVAFILTALLLFALAAFGIEDQGIADPISTSAVPQPDWLFIMFFQVTRYFQDGMEMVGVFWLPLILVLGMFFLPFIDRGEIRKKWIKWSVISLSLAAFLTVMVFTYHTSSTTPIWSCAACHKKTFGTTFGNAPEKIADFYTIYDNKWLATHYRYPQYFWMIETDLPGW